MGFNYYIPTRIFFGAGSVNKLKRAELPGKKAIVITGGTSTTKLGYVDKVKGVLKEAGVSTVVYNKVQPNPTIQNVNECVGIIKNEGCDFVVGLGGGSSIDTSKAAAVLATNGGELWDYISGGSGKSQKLKAEPLPIIAITTTAGTGTEADPWSVITNGEEKIGFGFDGTFPKISVVDPDFMMTVPPKMTAYQGFDALFHAAEGYIAKIANPISEMFSLKSIELIGKSLAEAVNNGENKQARADIALANTLSGFVESISSCTSEHAMEHALSALHPKLPHGAGLIMLSVEYYKHFAKVCPEKLINMAIALGKKDASKATDFVDVLYNLQVKCGVENLKMSDYGVDNTDFEKYADNALNNMGGLFTLDLKPLTRDEIIGIYDRSYK